MSRHFNPQLKLAKMQYKQADEALDGENRRLELLIANYRLNRTWRRMMWWEALKDRFKRKPKPTPKED